MTEGKQRTQRTQGLRANADDAVRDFGSESELFVALQLLRESQRAQQLCPNLKEGKLKWAHEPKAQWKMFCVRDGMMIEYGRKGMYKPRLCLCLARCKCTPSLTIENGFVVTTATQETYEFVAETPEGVDEWVDVVMDAKTPCHVNVVHAAQSQVYLATVGRTKRVFPMDVRVFSNKFYLAQKGRDGILQGEIMVKRTLRPWKQRYVVLRDGYYLEYASASSDETKPLRILHLPGTVVTEGPRNKFTIHPLEPMVSPIFLRADSPAKRRTWMEGLAVGRHINRTNLAQLESENEQVGRGATARWLRLDPEVIQRYLDCKARGEEFEIVEERSPRPASRENSAEPATPMHSMKDDSPMANVDMFDAEGNQVVVESDGTHYVLSFGEKTQIEIHDPHYDSNGSLIPIDVVHNVTFMQMAQQIQSVRGDNKLHFGAIARFQGS